MSTETMQRKKTTSVVLSSFCFVTMGLSITDNNRGPDGWGVWVTRVKELFGFLELHSRLSITGLMLPPVLLFRLEKDQSEKGKSVLKGL